MPVAAGNGELTITCVMGKFLNGELAAVAPAAKAKSDSFCSPLRSAARGKGFVIALAYPYRSSTGAEPLMYGPLGPKRKRLSVFHALKYLSNMMSSSHGRWIGRAPAMRRTPNLMGSRIPTKSAESTDKQVQTRPIHPISSPL